MKHTLVTFGEIVREKISKIEKEQLEQLEQAAKLLLEVTLNNKKIYAFGTGHSYMIGQEMFARAGGYANIIPILENELSMNHAYKSTLIERMTSYAKVIEDLYPFEEGDAIIMTSNSGRNKLLIELAKDLQEKGLKIIVITAVEQSKACTSRHASGKKLYEFADVILDNLSEYGDATIKHEDGTCTGATSTIIDCFLVQSMLSIFVDLLVENNMKPEVFVSSNVDEGDALNASLFGVL